VEGQFYGYPFALTKVRHLVYQTAVITETLPTSWPGLLAQEEPASIIYPGAGPMGASFTLQYYLAAGGALTNEAGQPALQLEPLTTALSQLQQGLGTGVIDPQSGNTASVEQAWQIFANSGTSIVGTDAAYFLRQRTEETDEGYGFAPLPGPEGSLEPLVDGLTWAVSTPDPARQALAAELIVWLASSQNLGEWSQQSYLLPARPSALAVWPEDDLYVRFVDGQLENAGPFPVAANNAIMIALNRATTEVLLQVNTPQAAAEEAVASLIPEA
jgi:ABC-type glycerol-3-phosphate transport system substrate-binding protein